MEQGVDLFCPASANCPKDQRRETILSFVSKTFHERALRLKGGSAVNLHASAEYSSKAITVPLLDDNLTAAQIEGDPSTKSSVYGKDKLSSKQRTTISGMNGASRDQGDTGPFENPNPSMLHMQGNIDPRLRQGFHETSDSATSEPVLSSTSTGHIAFTAVLESVVYPTLRKSKKRHKESLPLEGLDAVEKIVSFASSWIR